MEYQSKFWYILLVPSLSSYIPRHFVKFLGLTFAKKVNPLIIPEFARFDIIPSDSIVYTGTQTYTATLFYFCNKFSIKARIIQIWRLHY